MSQPASDATAAAYRRKTYAKLIIFIILMLIVWLQPKVQTWLENRKAGGAGGSNVTANNDSASSNTAQIPSNRSKVVIKDVDEPVVAEVDRTNSETSTTPVITTPSSSVSESDSTSEADAKTAADAKSATAATEKSKSTKSKSNKKKTESGTSDVTKSDAAKSDAAKSAKVSPPAEKSSTTKSGSSSSKADNADNKVAGTDAPKSAGKKSSGSGTIRMDRDDLSKRRTAGEEPTTSKNSTATSPDKSTTSSDKSQKDTPALGQLREIRDYVFESTAGLLYVKGSADGHRLKHVMQHAKDDLSKPKHGVFEGDRDQILAVIDEAYEKTKKGGKDVRKSEQDGRTVYIVNLGRKIGYVGGSSGERSGNPDCRYVQLVLEDENVVITAYPTRSF